MSDLVFDIVALDHAARTFIELSEHVERLSEKLERLDNDEADIVIKVHDEEANRKLDEIDKKSKDSFNSSMSRWQLIGTAVAAGLVAFGPAAAGVLVAGLGAGFIALAALAEKSNEDIKASFGAMKNDLTAGFTEWAGTTVPYMTQAMDDFSSDILRLGPEWTQMFTAVAPGMETLAHGLSGFVSDLMPGFIAAAQNASPVLQGFDDMLSSVGTGLSDLLVGWSNYSATFGYGLQQFGVTVQDVLGLVGNIIIQLTQMWQQNAGQITTFFKEISDVLSGAVDGAFNVFGYTLRFVFDAINGLMFVLAPFSDVLGSLGGLAVDAYLGFKGFEMVKGWVGGAVEALGKLNTNLGLAADALAGPLGIAVGLAIFGLMQLGESQSKAAEEAANHQRMVDNLSEALRQSNGVIDENVRSQLAQQIQADNTYSSMKDFGISLGDLTDIALGNGDAYDRVKGSLEALINTRFIYDSQTGKSVDQNYNVQIGKQLDILNGLRTTYGDVISKNRELAAAVRGSHDATTPFNEALKTLADTTATAADKAKALKTALDELAGKNITAQEASDHFQQSLLGMADGIKKSTTQLTGNSAEAIKNRQNIEQAGKAALDHAEAVRAQTGDVNKGKDAFLQDTQALYDNAVKVYGNRDAVNRLLDSLGLMPKKATDALSGMVQFTDRTSDKLKALTSQNWDIKVRAYGDWYFSGSAQLPNMVTPRASGGPIYGPGGETDDMAGLYALSHNEYVIRASSHRKYGTAFLDSINKGTFPGYADGGAIGLSLSADSTTLLAGMDRFFHDGIDQFAKQIGHFMSTVGSGFGGNVAQWAPLVGEVLSLLGQPLSLIPNVLRRMNQESGGNPFAVNMWDVNALMGHPSMGLMQTIPGTFAAYAGPFAGRGIFDPEANIYAGLNYAIHNYPSLQYAMDKPGGYKNGGILYPGQLGYNETSDPEAVLNKDQWGALVQSRGTRHVTVNVYARTVDADDIVNAVQRVEGLYF